MLLPATEQELAGKTPPKKRSFLARTSAITWQLIIVLIVLFLTGVIFFMTSRREAPPVINTLPTMTPVMTQIPTPIPASNAAETADWTKFSYTYNGQTLRLKYPPGMKITTNTQTSAIDTSKKIPTISFTDSDTTITLSLEDNMIGTLNNWVALNGTKQATQGATLNTHPIITQYTADKLHFNAYMIFDINTILWARSTTRKDDEDTFKLLLSTLQIGK